MADLTVHAHPRDSVGCYECRHDECEPSLAKFDYVPKYGDRHGGQPGLRHRASIYPYKRLDNFFLEKNTTHRKGVSPRCEPHVSFHCV